MPRWQKYAAVVEESCAPSAIVTIYIWVYLHSPPVLPFFLQIFLLHMSRCWKVWEIRAFVENRGDIFAITIMWPSQGSCFGPLYYFPTLLWKMCGRRHDSFMFEPLIHASAPQCSAESPSISQQRRMDTRETKKNHKDGHRHSQLESV